MFTSLFPPPFYALLDFCSDVAMFLDLSIYFCEHNVIADKKYGPNYKNKTQVINQSDHLTPKPGVYIGISTIGQ